jgi:hypothetical protein
MDNYVFTTTLGLECREQLEDILYFNARQSAVLPGLEAALARYGAPRIFAEKDTLRVALDRSDAASALFALDASVNPPRLAAVAVFLRPDPATLTIAHLAVGEADGPGPSDEENSCGFLLVRAVADMARRLRGVQRVELPYWTKTPRYLKVR